MGLNKSSTLIVAALAVGIGTVLAQPADPPAASNPSPAASSASLLQEGNDADTPSVPVGTAKSPASDDSSDPLFNFVRVSSQPFFHGSGLFALGGAIGGLIASGVYKDEPNRIASFVKQERIEIGLILKSEFERQFAQDPVFMKVLKSKGSGKFEMQILYGITSVPFSDYRPYLSVRMRLTDSAGIEKWKDREYVGGHGNAKSIPYLDFFKSANDFKSKFEVAAKEVTQLLLKDFCAKCSTTSIRATPLASSPEKSLVDDLPNAESRATRSGAAAKLDESMIVGKTWIYAHPRDEARFGNVELTFSEKGVRARNSRSSTSGTWELYGGVMCAYFDSQGWRPICLALETVNGNQMELRDTIGKRILRAKVE